MYPWLIFGCPWCYLLKKIKVCKEQFLVIFLYPKGFFINIYVNADMVDIFLSFSEKIPYISPFHSCISTIAKPKLINSCSAVDLANGLDQHSAKLFVKRCHNVYLLAVTWC